MIALVNGISYIKIFRKSQNLHLEKHTNIHRKYKFPFTIIKTEETGYIYFINRAFGSKTLIPMPNDSFEENDKIFYKPHITYYFKNEKEQNEFFETIEQLEERIKEIKQYPHLIIN